MSLIHFLGHSLIFLSRSESKSGMDKSLRKSGGGPHNWGSLKDELSMERDALEDEALDREELEGAF